MLTRRLDTLTALVPIQLTPEEQEIVDLRSENRELKIYCYTLAGILLLMFLAARR